MRRKGPTQYEKGLGQKPKPLPRQGIMQNPDLELRAHNEPSPHTDWFENAEYEPIKAAQTSVPIPLVGCKAGVPTLWCKVTPNKFRVYTLGLPNKAKS